MRTLTLIALTLLSLTALAGCNDDPKEDDGDGTGTAAPATDTAEGCSRWTGGEAEDAPQPVVSIVTNMGTIEAEICLDAVPVTARNFLDHVESGGLDGTRFHRIIKDFMMQGGDPNSKDDDPSNDGSGGAGEPIPDEFHRLLRHDSKGVLSMANAGANTGTTQFFITFVPTPGLDDRHAVFGHVVRGMDVLDRVEDEAGNPDSRDGSALAEVLVEDATIEWPEAAGRTPEAGDATLWTPSDGHPVPAEGGRTTFIVVAESQVPYAQQVSVAMNGTTAATPEEGFASFELPARQRVLFLVETDILAPPAEGTAFEVMLQVAAGDANVTIATQELRVVPDAEVGQDTVEAGEPVRAHYKGFTVDGRVFDTSVGELAAYIHQNDLGFGSFQVRPQYQPFTFTPGSGVIQGFTDLAVGMPEGGTDAARIPAARAYGDRGQHALAGRVLVFELEILEITAGE